MLPFQQGPKWLALLEGAASLVTTPRPRAQAHAAQHPCTYIIFLGAAPEVGASGIAGNVEDSNSLETGERDGPPVTLSSGKAGQGEKGCGIDQPSSPAIRPQAAETTLQQGCSRGSAGRKG